MNHERYRDLPLITPNSIRNAVLYDGQIRLWFRKLLTSSEVLKEMAGHDQEFPRRIRRYQRFLIVVQALPLLALGAGVMARISVGQQAFLWIALVVMAVIGLAICVVREHRVLAGLAVQFIERDLTAFPPGMTMYQMGEVCSRRYRIPSLVDMIWIWEQWLRTAFIVAYCAAFGVYFLSFREIILWTLVGCFSAVYLVKCYVLWRRPGAPVLKQQ